MQFLKLILLSFLLAGNVFAQEELETNYRFHGKKYSIMYKLEDNLQTVRLSGTMMGGIVEKLEGMKHVTKLLRKDVDIKVILSSLGGDVGAFGKLEKAMKKACDSEKTACQITTIVPSWAMCGSACINMFMVGDHRLAGKSSRFGFHEGSLFVPGIRLPGLARSEYIKRGVDEKWFNDNIDLFKSTKMSFIYPREMVGSNIITEVRDQINEF